jgi:DNA (cytosine-5)-methyltransferase 1
MKKFNHIDTFSGIGGFALAGQTVWEKDFNTVCFCDIEPFCQQVLKKNFGSEILIYGDIRTLTRERFLTESDFNGTIDLITGGFPCQPVSQAGKRKGTGDDRFLWDEMFRVIQEFQPRWCIIENVRGILTIEQGMVFEKVCTDLESENYEVQAFIIPACAVNAPHRRERVWFVAYSEGKRNGRLSSEKCGVQEWKLESIESEGSSFRSKSKGCIDNYSKKKWRRKKLGITADVIDTECSGLQGCSSSITTEQNSNRTEDGLFITPDSDLWERNWVEVASDFCGVDDGSSVALDGYKLSAQQHRKERLKALGNAIVPAVAVEIMKAIKQAEEK